MGEENTSFEFRLKNIYETRNYFLEKIKYNGLISRKHKKTCTTLNYIKNLLVLASTVTGCFSISSFCSLVGISVDIASSAVGLKMFTTPAGIKKYKSIIKKKVKRHDKINILAKTKLKN